MTTPSTPPNNEKAQNVIIGIGLFLVALFLFFVVFKDDPKEKAITTNYEESNYDTSSPATSVTEPASESYSSTSIPDEDPYYIMSVAFEGNPEENSIKLLVEEVFRKAWL